LGLTAAYVLVAAIVSLLLFQERFADRIGPEKIDAKVVTADPTHTGFLNDWFVTRSNRMESQEPLTPVFERSEMGTAATVEAGSQLPADHALSGPAERAAALVGTGVRRAEDVIKQYPWPTLLLGVGLGFLLARRVR
jgi:hypothetical protein